MPYETTAIRDRHSPQLTAAAAIAAGELYQLPDGRAGYLTGTTSVAQGDAAAMKTSGIVSVPKTTGIAILDGGPVYWDHSENKATFKRAGDRDFFLGVAVGDAASADQTMAVNLNVLPRYVVDVARDPFDSAIVLTAGAPSLTRLGGAHKLAFDTTAEAQKIDILSKDSFALDARAIIEFAIEVVDGGDAAALDFVIGAANGTDSDDADDITESIFFHLDGNDVNVYAESDDGTTEVAATDTTVDYTAGTRIEGWIDLRDPSDPQLYLAGVLVLGSTVFDVSAAAGPLRLLAHLEKSADDTPGEIHVEWLRARTMQQATV